MAKKRKAEEERQSETPSGPAPNSSWSATTRFVLSIVAVLHLLVVFSAPWAMPQPSSQLARSLSEWTSPISNLLYMRHGYRFFAPDPGPSHLILYEVTQADGEIIEGQIPDRQKHTPRLMYHRFFMISEHFWGLGADPARSNKKLAEDLRRAESHLRENGFSDQANWIRLNTPADHTETLTAGDIELIVEDLKGRRKFHAAKTAEQNLKAQKTGMETARKHREIWLAGIANYLKRAHGGTSVRIWIQEHLISDYDHILDGGHLTDGETYGPRQLVFSEDEVIE